MAGPIPKKVYSRFSLFAKQLLRGNIDAAWQTCYGVFVLVFSNGGGHGSIM
jgi:hypothetical protein